MPGRGKTACLKIDKYWKKYFKEIVAVFTLLVQQ